MDSNISELVKLGYERADELKAACGAVDVRSVAQLISDLASQLEVQYVRAEESQREFRSADITMQNLEAKCEKLAAENAVLKAAHPQPFGPEMMKALDAYEKHQDEVPETGMLNAFFILRDSIRVETPATDAFLAEVRASALDEFARAQDEQAKKYYERSPGCSGQNECQFAAGQAWYFAECIRNGAAQLRKGGV